MAEYAEVIKQFKRMCWFYSRDKTQKSCPMCTSYPNCNIGQCRKIAFERPREFAGKVMLWAAEHPEPVYPTWAEWLESMHVVNPIVSPDASSQYLLKAWYYDSPIPADIAQKLGLKPKEGI